jgi:ferrochelatase
MRLLRERLKLDETRLIMTFQSRFGRAQWLEPATDRTVKELAGSGVKSIAVITPGFSSDCLETLEEIAVENAHLFKTHGGRNFAAIPCLNDSDPGMLVIRHIALRELKGWT